MCKKNYFSYQFQQNDPISISKDSVVCGASLNIDGRINLRSKNIKILTKLKLVTQDE